VTVIGTVRNERRAWERSWKVWEAQHLPAWLTVEYLVLDEGSSDGIGDVIAKLADAGRSIRHVLMRPAGDPGERTCTLAFNAALRQLVRSPLVMFQWWDRIPGSFEHLERLVSPHVFGARSRLGGFATSAVSRHVGGRSSMEAMSPAQLEAELARVDWERDPRELAKLAGKIGAHCKPGRSSESSGLVIPTAEQIALGGWDERYTNRASFVNVELFRRLFQAGLSVLFVPEPHGANYHQSHPCPTGRVRDFGFLREPEIKRNPHGWGETPILDVYPPPEVLP